MACGWIDGVKVFNLQGQKNIQRGISTSLIRLLTQGQKDNALSYVRPELLNTIMGLRTKLLTPTKCISVCSVSWRSF